MPYSKVVLPHQCGCFTFLKSFTITSLCRLLFFFSPTPSLLLIPQSCFYHSAWAQKCVRRFQLFSKVPHVCFWGVMHSCKPFGLWVFWETVVEVSEFFLCFNCCTWKLSSMFIWCVSEDLSASLIYCLISIAFKKHCIPNFTLNIFKYSIVLFNRNVLVRLIAAFPFILNLNIVLVSKTCLYCVGNHLLITS